MASDYRDAIKILTDSVGIVGIEEIELGDAFGRVLAVEVRASEDVPSFDRSPYDGYAFRAEDVAGAGEGNPVTLKVVDNIRAGEVSVNRVINGTAIRLMTGAKLPEGADAICKFEDTDFTDEAVTIYKKYGTGDNVIRAGEDIKKDTLLAMAGSVVDAGLMGTMASFGMIKVKVYKRPVAGIISTGDELVDAGCVPNAGKIRNSNRYVLAPALENIGIDTVYLGHAKDRIEDIVNLIDKGYRECDIVISTGGVSVGDYDLLPDAMEESGYEIRVRGVGMKPGMACAYGVKDGKVMLALSGNPASSLTNLQCICYPALRKLAGRREYDHKPVKMKLKNECRKAGRGTRFLRGHLEIRDGEAYLAAPGEQGNVVISSAIGCNAYGILTDMKPPVAVGTLIDAFLV